MKLLPDAQPWLCSLHFAAREIKTKTACTVWSCQIQRDCSLYVNWS